MALNILADSGVALVVRAISLVRSLHPSTGLIDRSLGVVVRLNRQPILVDRPLALPRDVEDVSEVDVAPYLRPARVGISAQRIAEAVCGRLIVALHKEDFADAIGRQRARLIRIQCLL